MGYASYFEDIVDRLNDGFHQLKADIENESLQVPPEKLKASRTLIDKGEKLFLDLADIATRPDMNHCLEIWNLKNQNSEIRRDLEDTRKEIEFFKKQIKQMKIDHELNLLKENM
jgi:hypothetical protein